MSRLQRRLRLVRDIAANALNGWKISEIRSSIGQLIANAGKRSFCAVRCWANEFTQAFSGPLPPNLRSREICPRVIDGSPTRISRHN